jgi:hypothetical protein
MLGFYRLSHDPPHRRPVSDPALLRFALSRESLRAPRDRAGELSRVRHKSKAR